MPGRAGTPERPDRFARTLAREEFGRFYWSDAQAAEVARQQARTAERLEEMRSAWKAEARARAKAARKELLRKIRQARQAKASRAHEQPGE
jgi:hypothetical protein